MQAFEQGRYLEAIRQFQAALDLTTAWPLEEPRVFSSFMNLASAHYAQTQYAQALPLYQRALAIQEQLSGPDHPALIPVLQAYAATHRKLAPWQSRFPWSPASRLTARARRLQAQDAQRVLQDTPGGWFSDLPTELLGGPEH